MTRLIFLCALVLAPLAGAEAPVAVLSARVEAAGAGARVVVALDRPAVARSFVLAGPDRLVVDVPAAQVRFARSPAAAGPVIGVRHGPRPNGDARLVFDLSGPAAVRAEPVGARLIYTVTPTRTAGPRNIPAAATQRTPAVQPPPPVAAAADPALERRRVIVIDAGHGGHDPGAPGASGSREKAVTLAAALQLRDELEARGGYHVVLTRDGDEFLPLDGRVRIARENRADLFLSLHADSNPNAAARGATVYTLSERGGARAKGVMEAKDWDLDLGEAPRSAEVQRILVDLAQRETTNKSADFAETLIGRLSGTTPLLRNSHRNAGYFVLLAPDVPAVLLEMGFMTNAQDEARLTDPEARRRMMAGVADAIDVYFERGRAYASR